MDWKIPQITSMHYFDFHFAYWHWEVSTLFHLRKKNQWNRPCRQKNCSKWAPPQRHQAQKIRHPPAFAFPVPSLSLLVPPGSVFATSPAAWSTRWKSMESRICPGSCTRYRVNIYHSFWSICAQSFREASNSWVVASSKTPEYFKMPCCRDPRQLIWANRKRTYLYSVILR